jgi:hypothetical protein
MCKAKNFVKGVQFVNIECGLKQKMTKRYLTCRRQSLKSFNFFALENAGNEITILF